MKCPQRANAEPAMRAPTTCGNLDSTITQLFHAEVLPKKKANAVLAPKKIRMRMILSAKDFKEFNFGKVANCNQL